MTAPPFPLDLLRISRATRDAAVDGNIDRLHDTLAELRAALVRQDGASPHPSETSPAARIADDGRRRLVDLLDAMLFTVDAEPDGCTCIVRAAEVEVALGRQARLEAVLERAAPQRRLPSGDRL